MQIKNWISLCEIKLLQDLFTFAPVLRLFLFRSRGLNNSQNQMIQSQLHNKTVDHTQSLYRGFLSQLQVET